MAEFGEGDTDGASSLSGHVDATCFCFSGRGHHIFNCVAHDLDGCIVHRIGMGSWIIAKNEPSSSARSSLWENEVGCISLQLENHVAGMIT